VTDEACPEFLRPRLRIFLSADIVGSTKLKQSPLPSTNQASSIRTESRMAWFSKIQGFYIEAYRTFMQKWQAASEGAADLDRFGDAPTLWKTVGDEILFAKFISDHRQVAETLRVWLATIHSVRQFLQKDSKALDIKATAWVADFPLRNSEVAVISSNSQLAALMADNFDDGEWFTAGGRTLEGLYKNGAPPPGSVDFIGPAIDTGFRLSGFSSHRRFVISLDVAYILALTNLGDVEVDPIFSIYYLGPQNLKGVMGGQGYPLFWLDASPLDSVDRLEDNLTGLAPLNRDRLKDYCSRFYKENVRYIAPPFIVSGSEQILNKLPEGFQEDHEALIKSFVMEASEVEEMEKSLSSDRAGGAGSEESLEKMLELLGRMADASDDRGKY
jgi:hypothetical protein